jgi:hypothetical protein
VICAREEYGDHEIGAGAGEEEEGLPAQPLMTEARACSLGFSVWRTESFVVVPLMVSVVFHGLV